MTERQTETIEPQGSAVAAAETGKRAATQPRDWDWTRRGIGLTLTAFLLELLLTGLFGGPGTAHIPFSTLLAGSWLVFRRRTGLSLLALIVPLLLSPLSRGGPIGLGAIVATVIAAAWIGAWSAGPEHRRQERKAVRQERKKAERQECRAAQTTQPLTTPPGSIPGQIGTIAPTNGFAIAALVLGIIGGSVLAIVFGHVARSQNRRTGQGGSGMALAGLILGYAWLAASLAWLVAVVVIVGQTSSNYY